MEQISILLGDERQKPTQVPTQGQISIGLRAKFCTAHHRVLRRSSFFFPVPRCPANSTYSLCSNLCTNSCAKPTGTSGCPQTCAEGCSCNEGFAFNGERCVPKEECGCFVDGIYYRVFASRFRGGLWVLLVAFFPRSELHHESKDFSPLPHLCFPLPPSPPLLSLCPPLLSLPPPLLSPLPFPPLCFSFQRGRLVCLIRAELRIWPLHSLSILP